MSALQSRERVLAELGVRSTIVRSPDDWASAAERLGTDVTVLERIVTTARRDGHAADASASLGAWSSEDGVLVCSTAHLRADALAWAGVAHELRNALTTVAGWAQVASEAREPSRTRQAIDMVRASARDAMDVAPMLLDAKTSGESTDAARVLRQVVERFAPVASARDVVLACRRLDEVHVTASRAALASIVANLVKNALEACERGGRVEVGVRVTQRGAEIVVEDDGRGMSPETVRDVFAARSIASASPQREGARAGRGVGLSVVQVLVARAGGQVRVTSKVGAGSCVRVDLPKSQKAAASSGVRERSASRRILVVDDHAALADLVASTLESRGATVFVTADPARAVAAAEEERFDVALVDLDLGETTGNALVRTLVGQRLARRVVVMSGASVVPDLGADAVLRKPFDLADVEELALESTRVGKTRRAR